MRTFVLLATASLIALSVPGEASAQATRSMVASRVTVTVPERRSAASYGSTLALGDAARGTAHTGRRAPQYAGIGGPGCLAILELSGIGRISVSCLETAEGADRPAGVALQLDPDASAVWSAASGRTIELHLADGAVVRLHGREIVGGSRALYASLPAAAFQRVVESPRIAVSYGGRAHTLGVADSRALRAVAEALGR